MCTSESVCACARLAWAKALQIVALTRRDQKKKKKIHNKKKQRPHLELTAKSENVAARRTETAASITAAKFQLVYVCMCVRVRVRVRVSV